MVHRNLLTIFAILALSVLACGSAEKSASVRVQTLPPLEPTTAVVSGGGLESEPIPAPTSSSQPQSLPMPTPEPTATTPSVPTPTPLQPTATPQPTPTPALVQSTETGTAASPPVEGAVPAKVVNVVDGDTIDVLLDGSEYRVRYILVDTPETKHPTKGKQPFGPEATEANRQMVEGQMVYLEKDVSETDRYGRLLRYVHLADGRMVNEELLRLGLAQVSTYPPDVKYVDRFLDVQREARSAGLGMWGDSVGEGGDDPPPPPAASGLVITHLDKRAEYAEITNAADTLIDLTGWQLLSEKGYQLCDLSGSIEAGQSLKVWAMAADAGSGDLHCGFSKPVWNNSESDPAVLLDPAGNEVFRLD